MGNGPGDAEDYQQLIAKYPGFLRRIRVSGVTIPSTAETHPGQSTHLTATAATLGIFQTATSAWMAWYTRPHTSYRPAGIQERNSPCGQQRVEGSTFRLHNHLTSPMPRTSLLTLSYEVFQDGETLFGGNLEVPSLPPHGEAEITLPQLPEDGIATVTFFYAAKEDGPFYQAGHALGFDEILLSEEPFFLDAPDESGTVEVEAGPEEVVFTGENFRYVFDNTTGLFSSMVYNHRNLLTRPMEWNTFRAPTDNDQYIKKDWLAAGYDRPTVRVYSVEQEGNTVSCRLGIAAVTIAKFLDVEAVWTVDARGRVDVKLHCQRDTRFPFLPRFGLRLFLPKEFGGVEYFAYGPYESYLDKHRASRLGVYAQRVDSMHEDYIMPQENSPTWAAGTSPSLMEFHALTAAAEQPFSFNVSLHY